MSNVLINFKMKKLLIIAAAILSTSPALANQPFKYQTRCFLETQTEFLDDTCTVIETREKGGALRTRNIFSNRFGLTIKSRFDKTKGFVTWDSHNKYEYKWEYKVGGDTGSGMWTYVMPGILLENVSWD
jgi:hypothetical protein